MKKIEKLSRIFSTRRYKMRIVSFLFYILFLGAFLFSIRSRNALTSSDSGSKKKIEKKINEIRNKKAVKPKRPKKKMKRIEKKVEKKEKKKEKKKETKKKEKEILVIGDSLAYAMSLNNTYTGASRRDEMYWLTEGGVGIRFIPENFVIVLGKTMPRAISNTLTETMKIDLVKEVREKKIKHIAILIGINGSDKRGAKETVKRLEEMKEKTGCHVYYFASFPIVDSKAEKNGYQVRDSRAVSFNKWMKEGLKDTGIEYIDSYSILKKQKNYESYTWDGIHYQKEMYDKVLDSLFEKIERKKKEEEILKKRKNFIPLKNKEIQSSKTYNSLV